MPAWTAFAVTNLLERHFGHLVDYGFTATMEEALDVIARGEGEAEKWLHSFYFGNGTPGLRELVSDEHLAAIDPRGVSTIPIGIDDTGHEIVVRVGRYGPYVQREDDETASLPPDIAPDELTVELALELIAKQVGGPRSLGTDPETGLAVVVLTGRFGPYVQLGEQGEGTKKKPKRASLFATMTPETVTLDEALQLLSLPARRRCRRRGRRESSRRRAVSVRTSKRADGDSRSLATEEQLFTITMAEAEASVRAAEAAWPRPAAEAAARGARSSTPTTAAPVRVLDGRYGPYVTDGTCNATVPRGTRSGRRDARRSGRVCCGPAPRADRRRSARPRRRAAAKKAAKKKAPAKKAAEEDRREESCEERPRRRRSRPVPPTRCRPKRLTRRRTRPRLDR